MALQRARAETKRQLQACADFVKVSVFDSIAKGYNAITMPDLIAYLEKNTFFPRREDIEAILRRCDHDANRTISYAEFAELTQMQEPGDRGQENGPQQEQSRYVEEEEFEADDNFNDRVEDLDQTDELR